MPRRLAGLREQSAVVYPCYPHGGMTLYEIDGARSRRRLLADPWMPS